MDDAWGIIGHPWAVESLRRAAAGGDVSHAYLFTGPAGVGKTTLARALASALMCQEAERTPCGICRACRLTASGNHPDLHIVESARPGDTLKIEQVRELQRQLALTPVEARWQVAILRRFEEATTSAANALLKMLEEPPPYVVLVMTADDPDHLLPTIVSRCRHVPLRPLPLALVERALVERWGADAEQATLLAHLSGGRLGWAVRMLKDDAMLQRRAQRLGELNRLLGSSLIERFEYAEKLADDPGAVQEMLDLWTGWWRDVLLLAAGSSAALTNIDARDALADHARRFGLARSSAMVDALRRAGERLRRNANPRLTLEVLMLDLPRS